MDLKITGPDGEGFQLSAPEEAQKAREAAASRVKPRPEAEVPHDYQTWGNLAEAAAKNYPQPPADIRQVPQWIREHPEEVTSIGLAGTTGPRGRVPANTNSPREAFIDEYDALTRRRAAELNRESFRTVLSPAQVQERLSHYNRELSRGRITEQEYQGFRQGLGLSPAPAQALRPLSAAAPPRLPEAGRFRITDPSERTIIELSRPGALPTSIAPDIGPHRGVLGGNDSARQLFAKSIAPHIDEKTFATKYFNGMYSQNIKMTSDHPGELHFNGPLFRSGQGKVGKIERTIIPDKHLAYHNYFELEERVQGTGIAKPLMRNQFEIYRQLGINRVDLSANIDVGGYSWAKYGFVPITNGPGSWYGLQRDLMERLRYLRSPGKDMAERLIQTTDPFVIWDIAELTHSAQNIRYGQRSAETVPLGKALLLGQDWRGTFDMKNPDQMRKFNRYVGQ